jgi:hypothetical protein
MICSARGCHKPLTRATAIRDRDGRPFCKHHADRLPPYLRQPRHRRAKARQG